MFAGSQLLLRVRAPMENSVAIANAETASFGTANAILDWVVLLVVVDLVATWKYNLRDFVRTHIILDPSACGR